MTTKFGKLVHLKELAPIRLIKWVLVTLLPQVYVIN